MNFPEEGNRPQPIQFGLLFAKTKTNETTCATFSHLAAQTADELPGGDTSHTVRSEVGSK